MNARLLVLGLLVVAAAPASAQESAANPWQAFRGCWAPIDPEASRFVCFIPDGADARVVTVAGGRVVGSERVVTGDAAVDREGCRGTERVSWSASGRRIYRSADVDCEGGVHRRGSELIALLPWNEMVDVQGMGDDSAMGVRALRYARVQPSDLPPEVASAIAPAASPTIPALTADDVVEASAHAAAPVVEAWLIEVGQPLALDVRTLETLSRRGVPGSVTDALIAIAYPRAFVRAEAPALAQARPARLGDQYAGVAKPRAPDGYLDCRYYTQLAFLTGACYNALGPGAELGMYGYGRWYWYDRSLQPRSGGTVSASSSFNPRHGRVVNGEGYRPGPGSVTTSTRAQPRTSEGGSSGVSAGGGYSGSGSASSTARPAGDRTAKPRT